MAAKRYALSLHDALPISHHGRLQEYAGTDDRADDKRRRAPEAEAADERAWLGGHQRCVSEIHACTRSSSTGRSEEHTSELQSLTNLVCRLLLEKKDQRSP